MNHYLSFGSVMESFELSIKYMAIFHELELLQTDLQYFLQFLKKHCMPSP